MDWFRSHTVKLLIVGMVVTVAAFVLLAPAPQAQAASLCIGACGPNQCAYCDGCHGAGSTICSSGTKLVCQDCNWAYVCSMCC